MKLVQGTTPSKKPLPSGWDYVRLNSPQSKKRNIPGLFTSSSKRRRFAETNDDFRERALVE